MKIFFFCIALLYCNLFAQSFAMEPTIGCHCFKERTYSPEKRFAADPYLLTTSFNSFIAENFNISKRQIVMMKMQGGIDPDTLLIALYVAREGGVPLDTVLAVKENGGTWQQLFESPSIQGDPAAKDIFAALVKTGEDKAAAADIVTNQLVQDYFSLTEQDVQAIRKQGATGRELVLVNILASQPFIEQSALELRKLYSGRQQSWAQIAASYKLTPKQTGRLLGERSKNR